MGHMSPKSVARRAAKKSAPRILNSATVIAVYAAKKELSRILREARAGKRFIITRRGRAVAEIGPPGPVNVSRKCCWGDLKGKIRMADDFCAPLSEIEKYFT